MNKVDVDVLVKLAESLKAIPRRRDDSPELNTARNNAIAVCAALGGRK